MNKLLLIIVALLTVGCSEWNTLEYPLEFWLDEDTSLEVQEATLAAADTWNSLAQEKLGHDVLIYRGTRQVTFKSALRDSKFDVLELTETEDADFRKEYPYGLGACFMTWGKEARVDIAIAKPEMIHRWAMGHDLQVAYDVVSLHELGHALGLGHTSDVNDIMYPSNDPLDEFTVVTPGAEAEFCRLHGCK